MTNLIDVHYYTTHKLKRSIQKVLKNNLSENIIRFFLDDSMIIYLRIKYF